jgi:hypothetical protein
MWAGQSANLVRHTKAAELPRDLLSGVPAVVDRVAGRVPGQPG